MKNKISLYILITTSSFVGGFTLMAVELLYPRISYVWFGNILTVWSIDLSMSLLIIGIGYFAGSWLLKHWKKNTYIILISAYLIASVHFLSLPHFYVFVLDQLLDFPLIAGAVIFALLFMIPTMGILSLTSPLLVELAARNLMYQGSSSSMIYSISTLGGAISLLFVGLYFLPYWGIKLNCYMLGGMLMINFWTVVILKK